MIALPGQTGREDGGGDGLILTRDGLPHTAFPVRRPRPLGDLSAGGPADGEGWRGGGDSNPRCLRTPLFESGTINHSDTSPWERIAKGWAGAGWVSRRRESGGRAG